MTNEISYNLTIQLTNGLLTDSFASQARTADQAAAALVRNVQNVGFAAHEALGLGSLSTPGWGVFMNLDDTNFIEVGIDVGATFYPFLHLEPGDVQMGRLAAVPYALADTAAVDLWYVIYEE